MKNTTIERLKARNVFICRYFSFEDAVEFSCSVELGMKKSFVTSGLDRCSVNPDFCPKF